MGSRNNASTALAKNQPKELFGWIIYDWANHAFFTLVLGVLVGKFITGMAQKSVGENGPVVVLGRTELVSALSLYSYAIAVSVLLQVLFLPILGAIADYTHLKKFFLALFCYLGAVSCSLLYFVRDDHYLLGTVFFIIANLGAGASIVFFNSYLSDITSEDNRDRVSSWAFASGYAGGFLTLIIGAALIFKAADFGISAEEAARICFLFAGIWWGGFSIVTFFLLKSRQPIREAPSDQGYIRSGLNELADTFKELFKLKHTLHFLIAYLLYNDGIQTVIAMSAVFLSQELFVSRGLAVDTSVLIFSLMIAQVVGVIGALLFERVARLTNTKWAIMVSLIIWSCVVIYAYGFMYTVNEAYIMSGAIGLVLGGSQALSRSLFSQMIPKGRESAFFGIYAISERGTSWIGPLVFGLVAQLTNSYRPAILALIMFFVVGSLILYFVDTEKAIHQAGNLTPDQAEHPERLVGGYS